MEPAFIVGVDSRVLISVAESHVPLPLTSLTLPICDPIDPDSPKAGNKGASPRVGQLGPGR